MPCLTLHTNLTLDSTTREATLKSLSALVARELSKPEAYVLIDLKDGCTMSFGGTSEPLAHVQLDSLGFAKQPAELSATLCAHLQEQLQLEPARIYIKFTDHPRHMYGWNGKTFG